MRTPILFLLILPFFSGCTVHAPRVPSCGIGAVPPAHEGDAYRYTLSGQGGLVWYSNYDGVGIAPQSFGESGSPHFVIAHSGDQLAIQIGSPHSRMAMD